MRKLIAVFVLSIVAVLFFAGCAAVQDELSPSDLSLTELEKRMNKATDPENKFRSSKTYLLDQEVVEKRLFDDSEAEFVRVKFEQPAKFSLTTLKDNVPESVFCSDGERGWVADYRCRRVKMLSGSELKRFQVLSQLGSPVSNFEQIFPKVVVARCSNEDGNFYRIDCFSDNQAEPISFYVDSNTYLIRQMKARFKVGSGKLDYHAKILKYEKREGVMIPIITEVEQNGLKQESKVINYKLNLPFPATDFLPPVF